MSITAEDLLQHGQTLLSGPTEVCWRNSVGRSYYAAYHAVRLWHAAQPVVAPLPAGMGMHKALIESLIKPPSGGANAIRSRSLGYMLNHIKTFRTSADYELGSDVDQPTAETVAQLAHGVLERASK